MKKSAYEALQLGPTDGVILAWIPTLDQVMTYEDFLGETFYIAETPDSYMLLDSTKANLRWWQVKAAARNLGYNHAEPVWSGPAEDFSVECIPQNNREGMQLALRPYRHGPWVTNVHKLLESK